MRNRTGTGLVLIGGLALAAPAAPLGQSAAATVKIVFLADGRCAVAAGGEGFHSTATYKPVGAQRAAEQRCAMPPVPRGRTVSLTVLLPPGAGRPGSSTPPLQWIRAADRWMGSGSLQAWPDAVVVSASSTPIVLWLFAAGAALVLAAFGMRRRRGGGRIAPGGA